jgi:uncharacterized membrane protein
MNSPATSSPERVVAFSDGVMAVAITLLVLNLKVPDLHGDFTRALLDNWPDYAAYLVSFLTIGIMWVNHHAVFELVGRVDRRVLFINLGLLLSITLIPFTTNVVASAFVAGTNMRPAAVVYSGSLLLAGLAFNGLFVYSLSRPHLRAEHVGEHALPDLYRRFAVGAVIYPAATVLALVNAGVSVGLDAAVAVYYAILQVEAG